MTIRVRPAEVEVPEKDPFRNDLLDRKPYIEDLTDLLGAVEGPCVLALDSEWGGGKTTFLKMWASHLRNEGFFVAEFNAWETDYSGDPFVALSTKVQKQFQELASDGRGVNVKRLAADAKKVVFRTAPLAAGIAATAAFGSGAWATEAVTHLASYAGDRLEEYRKGQEAIDSYRITLGKETLRISDNQYNGRSLFIMIDELDRCRPSYAVELLEVAKHLFSVDRIVFVLAVNRSQLAHSVKALYGSEFDATGYLRRFFDLDYSLPTPKRDKFVLQLMNDQGISAIFQKDPGSFRIVPNVIACFLACSEFDFRRMAHVIHRIALVTGSLDSALPAPTAAIAVLLAIRESQPDAYTEFVAGAIDDMAVVEQIYGEGKCSEMEYSNEGYFLEATVCHAWFELESQAGRRSNEWEKSRLYRTYDDTITHGYERIAQVHRGGETKRVDEEEERKVRRARGVKNACEALLSYAEQMQFLAALRRIELLPT